MNKKVSIVIPNYNYSSYITECIQSIKNQTYSNIEIVVVDDKSTDNSIDIIKTLDIDTFILKDVNEGPASARNAGILCSTGYYILCVDSDNVLNIDAVECFVNEYEQNNVHVIYSDRQEFGGKNRIICPEEYSIQRLKEYNYIDVCSLTKKEDLINIGLFDTDPILIGFEDWDLFLNMGLKELYGKKIDKILYNYRVHPKSTLRKNRSRLNDVKTYLKKKYNF